MPGRYRVEGEAARIVCPIDGLTLLYHRPSGQTHVLVAPAPELIAALGSGPSDAAELLQRLGGEGDAEQETIVDTRLRELAAAGLIEPA